MAFENVRSIKMGQMPPPAPWNHFLGTDIHQPQANSASSGNIGIWGQIKRMIHSGQPAVSDQNTVPLVLPVDNVNENTAKRPEVPENKAAEACDDEIKLLSASNSEAEVLAGNTELGNGMPNEREGAISTSPANIENAQGKDEQFANAEMEQTAETIHKVAPPDASQQQGNLFKSVGPFAANMIRRKAVPVPQSFPVADVPSTETEPSTETVPDQKKETMPCSWPLLQKHTESREKIPEAPSGQKKNLGKSVKVNTAPAAAHLSSQSTDTGASVPTQKVTESVKKILLKWFWFFGSRPTEQNPNERSAKRPEEQKFAPPVKAPISNGQPKLPAGAPWEPSTDHCTRATVPTTSNDFNVVRIAPPPPPSRNDVPHTPPRSSSASQGPVQRASQYSDTDSAYISRSSTRSTVSEGQQTDFSKPLWRDTSDPKPLANGWKISRRENLTPRKQAPELPPKPPAYAPKHVSNAADRPPSATSANNWKISTRQPGFSTQQPEQWKSIGGNGPRRIGTVSSDGSSASQGSSGNGEYIPSLLQVETDRYDRAIAAAKRIG